MGIGRAELFAILEPIVFMYKLGKTQQKILLALVGGVALGSVGSPTRYYRILRSIRKDWQRINQQNFNRSIRKLAHTKLIEERRLKDGSYKLVATESGRTQARLLSIVGNSIRFKIPQHWDKKWRIVSFDIPEKERFFRKVLRDHLKALNFLQLQQSVFISPHPYEKPMAKLVAFYNAEPYVQIITAINIQNTTAIKKHFFKK